MLERMFQKEECHLYNSNRMHKLFRSLRDFERSIQFRLSGHSVLLCILWSNSHANINSYYCITYIVYFIYHTYIIDKLRFGMYILLKLSSRVYYPLSITFDLIFTYIWNLISPNYLRVCIKQIAFFIVI